MCFMALLLEGRFYAVPSMERRAVGVRIGPANFWRLPGTPRRHAQTASFHAQIQSARPAGRLRRPLLELADEDEVGLGLPAGRDKSFSVGAPVEGVDVALVDLQ